MSRRRAVRRAPGLAGGLQTTGRVPQWLQNGTLGAAGSARGAQQPKGGPAVPGCSVELVYWRLGRSAAGRAPRSGGRTLMASRPVNRTRACRAACAGRRRRPTAGPSCRSARPRPLGAATVDRERRRADREPDPRSPPRDRVVVEVAAGDDDQVRPVDVGGVADAGHAAGGQAQDLDPGTDAEQLERADVRRVAVEFVARGVADDDRHLPDGRRRRAGWRAAASRWPSGRRTPTEPTRPSSVARSRRASAAGPPRRSARPSGARAPPRSRRPPARGRTRRARRRASSRPRQAPHGRGKSPRRSTDPPGERPAGRRLRRA